MITTTKKWLLILLYLPYLLFFYRSLKTTLVSKPTARCRCTSDTLQTVRGSYQNSFFQTRTFHDFWFSNGFACDSKWSTVSNVGIVAHSLYDQSPVTFFTNQLSHQTRKIVFLKALHCHLQLILPNSFGTWWMGISPFIGKPVPSTLLRLNRLYPSDP